MKTNKVIFRPSLSVSSCGVGSRQHEQKHQRQQRFQSSTAADTAVEEPSSPTTSTSTSQSTDLHPLYPHLFTPLQLASGQVLANRVLMGSMHTGLEGHSMPGFLEKLLMYGEPPQDHSLDRMATYFQRRATGKGRDGVFFFVW
jgi:2,4-dienoyl-CoA reductase (NADPH2)